MPLKRFGVYLSYAPTVDLHKEGLGRLLAGFLRAAAAREDAQFVIACPEWSRAGLSAFCQAEGIPVERLEFVTTGSVPFLLRRYLARREAAPAGPAASAAVAPAPNRLREWVLRLSARFERRLVSTRSPVVFGLLVAMGAALGGLVLAALFVRRPRAFLGRVVSDAIAKVNAVMSRSGEEPVEVRLYRRMESAESERLLARINALGDVRAWYCPTAFWPEFHRIAAPRLMCVPDVFPAEFPVGFARLAPELVKNFQIVERSIRGASHVVTYSSHVKWRTVVARYAARPEAVSVVPHACWDLSEWIGRDEGNCRSLMGQALRRAKRDGGWPFLFYASQFRPNKNLFTLLQAFEDLARERSLPHKLVLTGDPNRYPPVADFLRGRGLEEDVVCLHGLSMPELAACYRLADLAVNPSLSEGGCPFTLTEALSVDTPVVMARIPVTEEVVTDPEIRGMMLFDPYDWRDAASRIEWALANRAQLLTAQRELYGRLRQRSWSHVVDDYIGILDGIADGGRS